MPTMLEKLARANMRQLEHDTRETILGYVGDRPQFGNLCSFLVGGMTDQGKTVITAYLCCMAVIAGGNLLIIDPHCNEKKHGLMHKIEPLSEWFVDKPVDFEDMSQVLKQFTYLSEEYKRRKSRGGMQGRQPLFLVVDEFNELLGELNKEEAKLVTGTIGNIARGGRKHAMYVILCAHNWDLSRTGGSDVRKNVSARISVACESSEMAMVLNTSDKKLLGQVCTPPLTKGEAIMKRQGFGLMRVRYPLTEREDCEAVARMMKRIMGGYVADAVYTSESESEERVNVLSRPDERIIYLPTARHPRDPQDSVLSPVNANVNVKTSKEAAIRTAAQTQKRLTGTINRSKLRDDLKLNNRDWSLIKQICDEIEAGMLPKEGLTAEAWEALKAHYNYTCLGCRKREPEITLTRDHVIPVSKGGANSIENIQPLCASCNASKRERVIDYRQLELVHMEQEEALLTGHEPR